jgi:predicted alpha-1,2-mannosidase
MNLKKASSGICSFIIILAIAGCSGSKNEDQNQIDYAQYVNPFIGTAGHGHTFPGATLPFGMVQLSPDNGRSGWDWCSGYNYSSDSIYGFSHTHISGTGIGDMLDISVLPTTANIPITYKDSLGFDLNPYYVTFSHKDEKAEPGYYSVKIRETGILAEFTTSYRTGFHKYTFPKSDTGSIILNLGFHANWDMPVDTHIKIISDTLITGFRFSNGWAVDQKVFFAMRLSQSIAGFFCSGTDTLFVMDSRSIQSPSSVAVLKFNITKNPVIMLKVALSSVSEENALANLNSEIADWDFDKARTSARTTWNKELEKVAITGATKPQLTVFYTALYHSMISPNIYSDLNSKNFQYRGPDDRIHTDKNFVNYHTFSLWDTYRAEHPLFTILNPGKAREFVVALLSFYRDSGRLPVWTLWGNETNTMIGYHSIPVITDAYLKGLLPDIKPDSLYKAMLASANNNDPGQKQYSNLGYLPADTTTGSVSKTLEYSFDDWCIAQMARELGKKADQVIFLKRASSYKNLFDPQSKFMRPRLANGKWKKPFDPFYGGYKNDYVEGNAWQYTWYVPQDVGNLIQMMGGDAAFSLKLDSLFSVTAPGGQQLALDVTGLIGQYAHGNEPSHHIPYLYNYSGQPWKTQKIVRQIVNTQYTDQPDGLCGNEDCGQMSAWYIFSSLGFYPVNPASGIYDIGSPLFPKASLQVGNGKIFNIIANNSGDKNIYVKNIKLNGREYNKYTIPHDSIMAGGTLEFEMSDQPKK